MAVLNAQQKKFLDKLFFDAQKLQQAVAELRQARRADAENSADPTGKEAVEIVAEIPCAMGYNNPEAWLRVVDQTWKEYTGTNVGKAMLRRYGNREPWQRTCMKCHISDPTYFAYRKEFILCAALIAARLNLIF